MAVEIGVVRIGQHADQRHLRQELAHQFETLRLERADPEIDAGGIAARPVDRSDEAHLDRIDTDHEYNRDILRRLPCFECANVVATEDDGDTLLHQLDHKFGQALIAFRPAGIERDVLAFDEAGFLQAAAESVVERLRCADNGAKKSDHGQRRLLSVGRSREPAKESAAGERHELPPHHSITSSARLTSVTGRSKPSALAVFRLMTRSYLFGACTGRSAGFSPFRMRST